MPGDRGSAPLALSWLDSVRDLGELHRAFEQMTTEGPLRFGVDNYTQYSLAWAFTLARHGSPEEAGEQLEKWLQIHGSRLGPGLADGVRALLAESGSQVRFAARTRSATVAPRRPPTRYP